MMPVRRTQSWLPSIFNDFFDNDWMVKAEPDLSVMWQGNRLYKSMERQRNICWWFDCTATCPQQLLQAK